MKQQKRKGFTLVELLVVIAILAILATVSIVGYTTFIKKAHVSNDLSLITQINTGLEAEEITSDRPNTLHEVRPILVEMGYDLNKFTPTATEYSYIWNSKTNRFILLDDKLQVVAPEGVQFERAEAFAVAHNQAEFDKWQAEGFSIYLDFVPESGELEITSVGVDVGECTAITKITYNNSTDGRKVIIRTNSAATELIINDASADGVIYHYDSLGKLTIEDCAMDSYHEYGEVAFAQIANGHFVAENGAVVKALLATAAEVKIDSNGGEIKNPCTTESSIQGTNHGGNVSLAYKDLELAEDASEADKQQALESLIAKLEQSTLFAGGEGTAEKPYLVESREQLENLSQINTYTYYKWNGPKTIDASNWSGKIDLCGSFDGNGVTFNNLDNSLFQLVWNGSPDGNPANDTTKTYTISNLTANVNIVKAGSACAIAKYTAVHNIVLDNVDVHGYIEGASFVASYVCYGAGSYAGGVYDSNITFKNCNSDATINATSGVATGFIAHAMMASSTGTIKLEDSNFDGTLSAPVPNNPNEPSCKYICGNYTAATISDNQLTIKNNVTYKSDVNGYQYIAENKTTNFTAATATLPANIGDTFELTAAEGATKAVISLQVSPNPGCMTNIYLSETIEVNDGKITSSTIKYFTIRFNASEITETGVNGNYFDIVNSAFDGTLGADTIVRITQYNAAGNIIAITEYNFDDQK